jgi:hypothetical protein
MPAHDFCRALKADFARGMQAVNEGAHGSAPHQLGTNRNRDIHRAAPATSHALGLPEWMNLPSYAEQ